MLGEGGVAGTTCATLMSYKNACITPIHPPYNPPMSSNAALYKTYINNSYITPILQLWLQPAPKHSVFVTSFGEGNAASHIGSKEIGCRDVRYRAYATCRLHQTGLILSSPSSNSKVSYNIP